MNPIRPDRASVPIENTPTGWPQGIAPERLLPGPEGAIAAPVDRARLADRGQLASYALRASELELHDAELSTIESRLQDADASIDAAEAGVSNDDLRNALARAIELGARRGLISGDSEGRVALEAVHSLEAGDASGNAAGAVRAFVGALRERAADYRASVLEPAQADLRAQLRAAAPEAAGPPAGVGPSREEAAARALELLRLRPTGRAGPAGSQP